MSMEVWITKTSIRQLDRQPDKAGRGQGPRREDDVGGSNMEKEKLNKLVKAVQDIGYCIVKLDATKTGRVQLELGIPVFVDDQGNLIDPVTKEPLPHFL